MLSFFCLLLVGVCYCSSDLGPALDDNIYGDHPWFLQEKDTVEVPAVDHFHDSYEHNPHYRDALNESPLNQPNSITQDEDHCYDSEKPRNIYSEIQFGPNQYSDITARDANVDGGLGQQPDAGGEMRSNQDQIDDTTHRDWDSPWDLRTRLDNYHEISFELNQYDNISPSKDSCGLERQPDVGVEEQHGPYGCPPTASSITGKRKQPDEPSDGQSPGNQNISILPIEYEPVVSNTSYSAGCPCFACRSAVGPPQYPPITTAITAPADPYSQDNANNPAVEQGFTISLSQEQYAKVAAFFQLAPKTNRRYKLVACIKVEPTSGGYNITFPMNPTDLFTPTQRGWEIRKPDRNEAWMNTLLALTQDEKIEKLGVPKNVAQDCLNLWNIALLIVRLQGKCDTKSLPKWAEDQTISDTAVNRFTALVVLAIISCIPRSLCGHEMQFSDVYEHAHDVLKDLINAAPN